LSRPLISLEDAALGYGRRPVLEHVDLNVGDGDFLGIVGPNGAGKSTLLKSMLGLLPVLDGAVTYGEPRRALRFGYVPQREAIDTAFPVTAFEVAAMGRYPLLGPFRRLGDADRAACRGALERVGLGNRADVRFRDLSGGQQQRVLIARALALEPPVLVLDEPTIGMDLESEHALMELVANLHARGRLTVILVSHLLNVVVNYVRSLVIVDRNRFLGGPVEEVLTRENLRSVYGTEVFLGTLDGRRVVLPCRGHHETS
jgi:ABC-type Mn2+/Zn2+ transport system ATPase subunit